MPANEKHEAAQHGGEVESLDQASTAEAHQAAADAIDEVLDRKLDSTVDQSAATVDERLAEAEREVLRARAELENFRKRMQRDAEQQLKYANVPLVRDLVEVIDNLKRASEAAETDTANSEALRNGVSMVSNQLVGILSKYGCKPIESVGREFDPNIHEAIAQIPSQEHAAGTVAQEVAVGYLLHDRVVRPSNVIVSTGPAS